MNTTKLFLACKYIIYTNRPDNFASRATACRILNKYHESLLIAKHSELAEKAYFCLVFFVLF